MVKLSAESPSDANSSARARSRRRVLRAGVLAAEFVALMLRFSTEGLGEHSESWAHGLVHLKALPQLALICTTSVLLFAAPRLEHEWSSIRPAARRTWTWWAQLAAFAAFYVATRQLLEAHSGDAQPPWPWIGAWVVATAALATTSVLLTVAPELWAGLSRSARWTLLGALGVGVGTWWIGVVSADALREPLRRPTLFLAHALLQWIATDAHLDAPKFVFGAGEFLVHLSPECSGFDGIGLIAALACAYLWLSRDELRFPRALWIPVVGVVLAWLFNAVRLALLVWIGSSLSPKFARGGFHSLAGLVSFCAIALTLIVASRRSQFFASSSQAPSDSAPTGRARGATSMAWLGPLLAYLAVGVAIDALAPDPDALYVLRPLAAIAVAWTQRPWLPQLRFQSRAVLGAITGAAVFALYWVTSPSSNTPDLVPRDPTPLWLVTRGVGYVAVTPWIEELAFRSYLLRRLTSAEFEGVALERTSTAAWLASSLAFGLLHQDVVRATLAGLAFGWVARRSGRWSEAVVAHAVANGLLFFLAGLQGDWELLG